MDDFLVIDQYPEWSPSTQNLTFTVPDSQPAPGDAFHALVSHPQVFNFSS
jgi:hypothetical protein